MKRFFYGLLGLFTASAFYTMIVPFLFLLAYVAQREAEALREWWGHDTMFLTMLTELRRYWNHELAFLTCLAFLFSTRFYCFAIRMRMTQLRAIENDYENMECAYNACSKEPYRRPDWHARQLAAAAKKPPPPPTPPKKT